MQIHINKRLVFWKFAISTFFQKQKEKRKKNGNKDAEYWKPTKFQGFNGVYLKANIFTMADNHYTQYNGKNYIQNHKI